MKYISHLIKKYPITIIFIIVIWYLSFFSPPKTELDNIQFIDKWVHILMYGGTFTVLWIEYLHKNRKINKKRLLLLAIIAPIAMSGLIEILQEYCTNGRRNGDWLDLAANSFGVLLAALIGLLIAKYRPK
jgi:VanZ family protein